VFPAIPPAMNPDPEETDMTTNNQSNLARATVELTLGQLEAITGGTSNQTFGDGLLQIASTVADAAVKVATTVLKLL
jgi:hypothetical protein